jgi:DNA gyrase subunit B
MEDVQAVQRRPGMYVGDTHDGTGLHNMVFAALDNAVAEVICGSASRVTVDLYPDGSCAVADDGRGMPVAAPDGDARPFPELLLTDTYFGMRHAVRTNRPETIRNTGLVPVNALSSWLDLRTVRYDIEYLIRFESGRLARPLAAVAPTQRRLPLGERSASSPQQPAWRSL